MRWKQAAKKAGGVTALADLLGIKRQAIYKWDAADLPAKYVEALRRLRPDWFTAPPKRTAGRAPS